MTNQPIYRNRNSRISARDFYSEFRGHRVEHLESLVYHLRNNCDLIASNDNINSDATSASNTATTASSLRTNIIWTAGDSSLDNKYWFHDTVPALSSYRHILHPPISKPDVTYWLNQTILISSSSAHSQQPSSSSSSSSSSPDPFVSPSATTMTPTTTFVTTTTTTITQPQQQQQQQRYVAVNGAVEASTLNMRTIQLLPQDQLIRDHMQEDDILIVSIGGNDVALMPLPCTVVSMLCSVLVCPKICIERGCIYGTIPISDCCCSCGPALWSCLCGFPPCLGYFRHLFGYQVQRYIERLTATTKPSKVVVCMIYYPDERNDVATWANTTLQILGYNTNPDKLQTFIRKMYSDVITTIQIKDTEMVYVPLYRILNGKNTDDYVARVEPSVVGGQKMAEYIYANLFPHFTPTTSAVPTYTTPSSSLFIHDRD
jgi:hypothetical protein